MTDKRDSLAPLADLGGVPEAVARARTAVDRMRAHPAMRRRGEIVSSESLRRGAAAAASLETGGTTTATQRGAGRAYGQLGTLRQTWTHSPLQVLARLHMLAARGQVKEDWLGRPRGFADLVHEGPDGTMLGVAAGPLEVHERLDGLVGVLASTRAPALVVAAVVHGEIATLRPFGWGNRVVALAAQRLVLVERGLDPLSQAVVEVGHRTSGGASGYYEALGAYASGRPAGVAAWVRHCGAAVEDGAAEGIAICEALGC